jgi:hypothetical protein
MGKNVLLIKKMPAAYVLINSEIGSEQEIISKLKKLHSVVQVS